MFGVGVDSNGVNILFQLSGQGTTARQSYQREPTRCFLKLSHCARIDAVKQDANEGSRNQPECGQKGL